MPDFEAEAPPPRARRWPVGIEAFVDHYNHQRYHESINNVIPADVYFGRDKAILKQRQRIKRKTLETRRLHHRQRAA
jgi:putative transposase